MNDKLRLSFLGALGAATLFMFGCGTPAADHNGHSANTTNAAADHSKMDHSSMQSSPHAERADFDLQFLDTMVVHHHGAVDMAKGCGEKAAKAEIKKLCTDIISSQTKEIEQMRAWRDSWFGGKEPAVNMQLAGMADSMKGMDLKKLGTLTGEDYDQEFIRQMIPHHAGAVEMSKEAISRSSRPEVKTLAEAIIKAQDQEIKQMKSWARMN